MTAIRSLFAQRHLAVLLCAAALLLRLIVPTGYMIGQVQGHAAIVLCPGAGPLPARHDGMAMAHHASPGHPAGHSDGAPTHDMPCAFAGLSAPGLAAADPVQLAGLVVFVMAVGIARIVLPPLRAAPHLRPPLRGPPPLS